MTNEEKEKMSATEFCRCYKCDKIEHNVISEYEPAVTFKWDKSKLKTCLQLYYGYRTAWYFKTKYGIKVKIRNYQMKHFVDPNFFSIFVMYFDNIK